MLFIFLKIIYLLAAYSFAKGSIMSFVAATLFTAKDEQFNKR